MGVLKWLFGTTIALKIADIATTYYLVSRYGAHVESNPFMYDMIGTYGLGWACAVSMLIYSMLMYVLYKYKRQNLMTVAAIFMLLVVLVNSAHMLILG